MARILLIDDEKLQLMLRSVLLEEFGYEVTALHNGSEAIAAFLQKPFDLVITDWLMPNMTGLDIARQIKLHDPSIPIIMLTGWGKLLDENDERRRDIDLLLPKPCEAETLLTMVRSFLEPPPSPDSTPISLQAIQ
jgi:two-component system, cell cycle sensor histidine kinase and response regulator CckA